jgi:4-aminobutyrate aminotransferase-like enzyme
MNIGELENHGGLQRTSLQLTLEEKHARIEASSYGPRSKALLRRYADSESSGGVAWALFDCPPAIVEGHGATVVDADGREYIDCMAGMSVSNLGHGRADIADAVDRQQRRLAHYFDMPGDAREELAERLAAITPGDHEKSVAFAATGSDAADMAVRMARWYTGAPLIVSTYGGYHGAPGGTIATTAKGYLWAFHYPVGPHDAGHLKVPFPYPYRPPLGDDGTSGAPYVEFLRRLLGHKESPLGDRRSGVSNVAAMLVEPMQGSGGYVIPPDDYLPLLRELCDEFGILLIADEIQTGMGRTGAMWACDRVGVVPDILLTSKGLANGQPIAAVVARREIANSWGAGAHISTFAGTPVAAAAANAVLDAMDGEQVPEQALEKGEYLRGRLVELQRRHPILGSIDIAGLFIGLEFVRDRETREPADTEAAEMLEFCVRAGVLFEKGGYHHNRFQLIPPLVIERAQLDRVVDVLDAAMSHVTGADARSSANPIAIAGGANA